MADQPWLLSGNAGIKPNQNFLGTTDANPIVFKIAGNEVLRVGTDNRVGIGLAAPHTPLHVFGAIATGLRDPAGSPAGGSPGTVTFFPPDGYAWFHIDNGPAGGRPNGRLRISYGAHPGESELMSFVQNGNIGIGTTAPRSKLDVAGEVTVQVLNITGADIAERFKIRAHDDPEPGTVLVITDEAETLTPSTQPFDSRVAGIVSGGGQLATGVILASHDNALVSVALAGRVQCLADATTAPIRPGDLLTTSGTPGHAMACPVESRTPGVVLGKALTSLPTGIGSVVALVSLQ
jgi:hypothetical protein